MVYIILFATVLIAFLLKNQPKSLQIIPFVILAVFAAIRYGFGNDYFSYYRNYYALEWNGKALFVDPLFVLLNRICPNFYVFIALSSIIFVVTIAYFVMKDVDSRYVWFSVFVFVINPYLFLMNLSAIRQCLAICLFIIAIRFSIKREFVPFLILFLLAFLLHKTALLLFPMYFVSDRKVGKGWVIGVLTIVFIVLSMPGLTSLVRYVVLFFNESNYIHYLETSGSNTLRATLLTSLFFIYVLGNLHRLEGKHLVYGKLYLVGVICGVFAYKLSIFTRPQMYFDIFSVLVLPTILKINVEAGPAEIDSQYVVKSVWNCVNRYVLPALIFVVYGLRFYSFFANPMWHRFTEYKTIFDFL